MRKGILIDETGDLQMQVRRDDTGKIISGLVVDDNNFQSIDFIVKANKGEFKEHPVLGVGAEKYLKSVGRVEQLRREIALQLESDGYKNPNVIITETGELTIDL